MKNINFNEFKKMGMTLEIGDKSILIQFIPYPVEKEIYTKMADIQELLGNIATITDEQIEMIKNWIWQIISHKRNENEGVTEEIFDEIGITEMIAIMIALIQFITERITGMKKLFVDESTEKKTVDQKQTT